MGLLTNLGLRPTPAVMAALAGKPVPQGLPEPARAAATAAPAAPAPAAKPAEAADAGGKPGLGDDASARKAAQALKDELDKRHAAAYAALTRLEEAAPKVDALIAAAAGPQKVALEAKKKLLEQQLAEAGKSVAALQSDIEKLGALDTSREEYVRILARNQSKARVGSVTEVDTFAESLQGKKPGEKHETTTTTSYENGRLSVGKTEEKRTLGLDGVTASKSKSLETSADGNTVKTSEENKTNVSLGGKLTKDEKRSIEIEAADGKKMTIEQTSSLELSAAGVTHTTGRKDEHRDGSSEEKKVKVGLERGDGKLGGAVAKTDVATDAAGNSTTNTSSGKGGLISGADGQGAFGSAEKGIGKQNANGVTTGAVAGLDASISCKIGKPVGKVPNLKYPLTLQVNLGASIGVSTGHEKKDSPDKMKVEAKLGKAVFLKRTYLLSEAETGGYVEALAAASAGSSAAATHTEFAIILAGIKNGWPAARELFLGEGSQNLKKGESREKGGSSIASLKLAADVKAVQIEAAVSQEEQHGSKATRAEDGSIDGEMSGSNSTKVSAKVGFKSGLVGASIGRGAEHKTSSGYVIKIDPKTDPKGVKQKAFDACDGQADYDKFAENYPDTVVSATRSKEDNHSETVGLSVGPGDVQLGLHNGVKQTTKTGKGGKLEQIEVVGSAGGGGSIGTATTRIGDSVDDEAAAKADGAGNADLKLTKSRKGTDWKKFVKAKVPFMGGDKDENGDPKAAKGALAKLTGAKDVVDTDSHDVFGLTLANKDLDAIAKIASGNARRWEKGAVMDWEHSHADWEACRKAIVASGGDRKEVAVQLAQFVGGSKTNRLDMLVRFLRPDGDVSIGSRANFPDSLKALQPDYERLVQGASELLIEACAAKEGPQKAGALGKEIFDGLETLRAKITAGKEQLAPAVRAEMISAIGKRKTLVLAVMQKNAGQQGDAEAKAALEAEYRRMTKACLEYQFSQNDIFEKFGELWAPGRTYNNVKLVGLLQQVRDLFAVWKPDYAKAAELGKKIGYPVGNYDRYQPAFARFEEWEKKIHQY